MSLKVQSFGYNFTHDAEHADGKAAVNFANELLEHYLRDRMQDFESILEATQITKRQAVASGLLESLDGKLKWQLESPSGVLPDRIRKLWMKLPRRIQNLVPTAIFERLCRLNPQDPWTLPNRMKSLDISAEAVPKRRYFSLFTFIDQDSRGTVEAKGGKPFLFGTRWTGECSIQVSGLNNLPTIEASLVRPVLPRIKPNTYPLPGLGYYSLRAHARDLRSHLNYLVNQKLVSLRAEYAPSHQSQISIGIDQYKASKRTSLYLRKIPDDGLSIQDRLYTYLGLSQNRTFNKGPVEAKISFAGDLQTPLSNDTDLGDTIAEAAVGTQVTWKPRGILRWRMRGYAASVGCPLSSKSVTDLPVYKRMFMGGPNTKRLRTPLRGFAEDRVGGFCITQAHSPTASSLRAQKEGSEHLGGRFATGMSVEVTLPSIYNLIHTPVFERFPMVVSALRRVRPMAFVDAGAVLADFPSGVQEIAQNTNIGRGVGLTAEIAPGKRLEATWGWAQRRLWNTTPTMFQIGFCSDM